jgi:hypothetical protein
VEEEAAE